MVINLYLNRLDDKLPHISPVYLIVNNAGKLNLTQRSGYLYPDFLSEFCIVKFRISFRSRVRQCTRKYAGYVHYNYESVINTNTFTLFPLSLKGRAGNYEITEVFKSTKCLSSYYIIIFKIIISHL